MIKKLFIFTIIIPLFLAVNDSFMMQDNCNLINYTSDDLQDKNYRELRKDLVKRKKILSSCKKKKKRRKLARKQSKKGSDKEVGKKQSFSECIEKINDCSIILDDFSDFMSYFVSYDDEMNNVLVVEEDFSDLTFVNQDYLANPGLTLDGTHFQYDASENVNEVNLKGQRTFELATMKEVTKKVLRAKRKKSCEMKKPVYEHLMHTFKVKNESADSQSK